MPVSRAFCSCALSRISRSSICRSSTARDGHRGALPAQLALGAGHRLVELGERDHFLVHHRDDAVDQRRRLRRRGRAAEEAGAGRTLGASRDSQYTCSNGSGRAHARRRERRVPRVGHGIAGHVPLDNSSPTSSVPTWPTPLNSIWKKNPVALTCAAACTAARPRGTPSSPRCTRRPPAPRAAARPGRSNCSARRRTSPRRPATASPDVDLAHASSAGEAVARVQHLGDLGVVARATWKRSVSLLQPAVLGGGVEGPVRGTGARPPRRGCRIGVEVRSGEVGVSPTRSSSK